MKANTASIGRLGLQSPRKLYIIDTCNSCKMQVIRWFVPEPSWKPSWMSW